MFPAKDVPKHMLAFHQALTETIKAAEYKTGSLESLTNLSQFMIGFDSAKAIENDGKVVFLQLYVNFVTWTQLTVPLRKKIERIKRPGSWQSHNFACRHYMQINYVDPDGIARPVRIYNAYVIKGTSTAALQGVTLQVTPQGMIRYNPHSAHEDEGEVCLDSSDSDDTMSAVLELPYHGK